MRESVSGSVPDCLEKVNMDIACVAKCECRTPRADDAEILDWLSNPSKEFRYSISQSGQITIHAPSQLRGGRFTNLREAIRAAIKNGQG